MISKCELCSVLTDVLDTGNVLIDEVYSLVIYCVNERQKLFYGHASTSIFVSVFNEYKLLHLTTCQIQVHLST